MLIAPAPSSSLQEEAECGTSSYEPWPLRGSKNPPKLLAEWGVFSLRACRRVCHRVGNRREEAQRNRSPRCLRGTMLHARHLPE
jgi:hypothetical protein